LGSVSNVAVVFRNRPVIEVKARARGRGNAEFLVQRHGAMMAGTPEEAEAILRACAKLAPPDLAALVAQLFFCKSYG